MKLIYMGNGKFIPGWPAADHEEFDEAVARRKLSTGIYKEEVLLKEPKKRRVVEEVEAEENIMEGGEEE
jgi:hypothetical protein